MRRMNRLTAVQVAKLRRPGRHADGGNLFLSIRNGGRSWVFKYADRVTGRDREFGLGSVNDVSLVEAREKASAARKLLAASKDPIAARRAEEFERSKEKTFGEFLPEFLKTRTAGLANAKHRDQWKMTLEVYAKPLHKRPLREIETADVLAVLQPLWYTKHETATRLRSRLENLFAQAKALNLIKGDNPARWQGNLKTLLTKPENVKQHHAALPYSAAPAFMIDLRARDSMSAKALEFCILCASRTAEVIGAKWDEFDLAAKVWTVPAERMKKKRKHRVPLSAQALAILRSMPQGKPEQYIFSGGRKGTPLSNMALLECARDLRDEITTHGFRATFSTWRAEATSFPKELAEFALAHVIGDKSEAAYNRGDLFERRRELMETWSRFLAGETTDNVIALAR